MRCLRQPDKIGVRTTGQIWHKAYDADAEEQTQILHDEALRAAFPDPVTHGAAAVLQNVWVNRWLRAFQ